MHPGEEAGCTFRLLPDLREVRRGLHGGVGGSTAGAPDSGGGGRTDKGLTSRTRTAGMDELALSNRPNALVHRDAVLLRLSVSLTRTLHASRQAEKGDGAAGWRCEESDGTRRAGRAAQRRLSCVAARLVGGARRATAADGRRRGWAALAENGEREKNEEERKRSPSGKKKMREEKERFV